ncbi:hypothetical protein TNCV_4534801 [Trichonephila clavipes]|nr:hypothetical protein TNCV_4534801 [Trichonephila clavipes]
MGAIIEPLLYRYDCNDDHYTAGSSGTQGGRVSAENDELAESSKLAITDQNIAKIRDMSEFPINISGHTINQHYCIEILKRPSEKNWRKGPELGSAGWV